MVCNCRSFFIFPKKIVNARQITNEKMRRELLSAVKTCTIQPYSHIMNRTLRIIYIHSIFFKDDLFYMNNIFLIVIHDM